ncbi:hypothetical protein GH769_00695 [Pseudomonas sp. CFSAN084952]|uniref:hypothetical protein n=1 Tax=Pseudomonas TaxID=286 RepID=UPI00129973C3|nr:hypothetical protein [Pseudomonas sp. CFSAN084952]QGF91801.1 hypothetical protein GH769_00695 [Pseudomonas sp. CFSAN084952]
MIDVATSPSDVGHITQPRPMIDVATSPSDVGHITPPGSEIGVGSELGDSARITQPRYQIGWCIELGVAARNTQPRSKTDGGTQPRSDKNDVTQAVGPPRLFLYIDASTNPLPSDYGFIAASVAAQLQHGHVNPLSKE